MRRVGAGPGVAASVRPAPRTSPRLNPHTSQSERRATRARRAASMSLLDSARALRESIRSLVEKRKAGRCGHPVVLNRFLSAAQSHSRLVWNKPRSVTIEKIRPQDTPEAILAPVAEAAADLLATADFKLVKRCEDGACVFWFADRTKSHHRRWCSMGICGNRQKVASYRRRLRDRAG